MFGIVCHDELITYMFLTLVGADVRGTNAIKTSGCGGESAWSRGTPGSLGAIGGSAGSSSGPAGRCCLLRWLAAEIWGSLGCVRCSESWLCYAPYRYLVIILSLVACAIGGNY